MLTHYLIDSGIEQVPGICKDLGFEMINADDYLSADAPVPLQDRLTNNLCRVFRTIGLARASPAVQAIAGKCTPEEVSKAMDLVEEECEDGAQLN